MKRFVSIITSVVFLALILTGCGSKTEDIDVISRQQDIEVDSEVTDLQLALLNDIVFKDALDKLEGKSIEGHDELINSQFKDNIPGGDALIDQIKGYTLIDFDHGDPTGFRAAAFTKGNSLVIVYCGTEGWILDLPDPKDAYEDFKAGIFDWSSQDGQAKQFVKDNIKKHKTYDLYITGYSMGGRLCYLGTEEACDNSLANKLKKVRTFNGLGVKEAFDITDGNLSNIHNLEEKFADKTCNYIVEGDFVSDENVDGFAFRDQPLSKYQHVGKEFRVPCTNEIDDGVMKQHSLYSIIDYLLHNPEPGTSSANKAEKKDSTTDPKTPQEPTPQQNTKETKSNTQAKNYIVGQWEAGTDSGIEFDEDGAFYFDWSYDYGITEEGVYSVGEWTSDNSFIINLDGTSLVLLMKTIYGALDSSYHFEILIKDDNNAYLVQVSSNETAETSKCKLPLNRIKE